MKSGHQTKRGAMVEVCVNVGTGFLISLLAWHYGVRPAIHAGFLSVENSVYITLIFTFLSVVRGFIVRRLWTRCDA